MTHTLPSMHRLNRRTVLGFGACAAAVAACPALAQGSDKPIRFILPISAGSGVDTIVRAASVALARPSASRW
jgi:tripartite-type tricarboxylate transporter receptor subunit TctC